MKDEIIERREEMIELFDAYGELLTKTQQDLFKEYYLYDLSLSEIAEDRAISRSAVNDTLKKAIAKLEETESKIKLVKTKKSLQKRVEKLEKAKTNEEKEIFKEIQINEERFVNIEWDNKIKLNTYLNNEVQK